MRLNDPLVTFFEYNGKRYDINLAFDNVLDVFDVFEDTSLRDYEKADICLALLIGEHDEDTLLFWKYVYQNFIYTKSKRPIEYDRKGNPMPPRKEKKSIDFKKDAEYIYASFQQAYNINLFREQGRLHWIEFKALLNGLPSNTIMQRIIQIRLWEPSKGDSSEYKRAMSELQEIYKLEDEEVDE